MVLQQTYSSSPRQGAERLDVNRILGISSTLALNVLALAMLLAPMTMPAPPPRADRVADMTVVPIVPVERATAPPEVVPVMRPRVQMAPRIRDTPRTATIADVPVAADPGILPSFAQDAPALADAIGADAAGPDHAVPLAGMQLQYERAPAPAYPRLAMQRGLEGVVLLRVLVGADGHPLEVTVEQGSGHAVLDREAQRHVRRHWTFRPALRDGRPVQAVGIVPIEFRLDRA